MFHSNQNKICYCQIRRGTDSAKWNPQSMLGMVSYADESSIPLWIADLDYKSPQIAIDHIKERVEHGVFGYPYTPDSFYDAVIHWMKKRHHWSVERDQIIVTPGVVPSICYAMQEFTKKGEGIIIQEPVYYPFKKIITLNERQCINNQLIEKNGYYTIDFDDLEEKAKDPNNTMMILCSPHNPIGRIWTKEELIRIGEICLQNNVLLCADEIHHDVILFNHEFTSVGNLSDEIKNNTIICTALSKTFNLAAVPTSNIIIPNKEIYDRYFNFLERLGQHGTPSIFGAVATQAVFSPQGEEWLQEILHVVEANHNFTIEYFKQHLPQVIAYPSQSTFLMWVDFRGLGFCSEEIEHRITCEAKVVLDPGSKFGDSGKGFMRINIGCSEELLKEALSRIVKVFK